MLAVLAFITAPIVTCHDVPVVVDVTSYARVQHALRDGTPDLTCPDNTFTRQKEHYVLCADSDTFPADADGSRMVHEPAAAFDLIQGYSESGPAPASLNAKFVAVSKWGVGSVERKTGSGAFPSQDQKVLKGNRFLIYHLRTTTQQVETHTEGNLRVTREWHSVSWSTFGTVVADDKPFDLAKENLFARQASFRMIPAPPIYRFTPLRPDERR